MTVLLYTRRQPLWLRPSSRSRICAITCINQLNRTRSRRLKRMMISASPLPNWHRHNSGGPCARTLRSAIWTRSLIDLGCGCRQRCTTIHNPLRRPNCECSQDLIVATSQQLLSPQAVDSIAMTNVATVRARPSARPMARVIKARRTMKCPQRI